MTFGFGLKKRIETVGSAGILMLVLAAMALLSGGCESFNHCSGQCCCTDSIFSGWRDHVWAKRAYYQQYPICEHLHPSHFRSGFIAGYSAVCTGEDTFLPAVPPKSYWGYSYQTAEGNQLVDAWFDGYPEGVKAANHDGAGLYRDVQVSSMLNAAMQPATDAWAPYASGDAEGQTPIMSEQNGEMPPVPELQVPAPLPENGTPTGWHQPEIMAQPLGVEESSARKLRSPLSANRKPSSWGLIR